MHLSGYSLTISILRKYFIHMSMSIVSSNQFMYCVKNSIRNLHMSIHLINYTTQPEFIKLIVQEYKNFDLTKKTILFIEPYG
ncbi:TPA: phosphoribosylglycinamide synthetase, partial [Legionella pneumophila]|nr:phosphoribosylglycinamide synthetase [Legionella pneumophila]